jgi:hypothetical protein
MVDEKHEVVVTDVNVHFWSMVFLLVKWAIAAIIAMVILYAVAALVSMSLDAIFGAGWHWWTAQTT